MEPACGVATRHRIQRGGGGGRNSSSSSADQKPHASGHVCVWHASNHLCTASKTTCWQVEHLPRLDDHLHSGSGAREEREALLESFVG